MKNSDFERSRRGFVLGAVGLATAAVVYGKGGTDRPVGDAKGGAALSVSLAQWSLHRAFQGGQRKAIDFARIARQEFGFLGIEYVNQFYFDDLNDALVAELRRRADSEGVRSLLIMCDNEGSLGDPDTKARRKTVSNHHRWADAAHALGCHSIRVNAASGGSPEEQERLVADGLRQLADYCSPLDLNVLVENHGGLSSNAQWLAGVMRRAAHPRIGTLPDFGNFTINRDTGETYDNYIGVRELMPFAHAVSAKSYDFNVQGNETCLDYYQLLRIVAAAGYSGWIGVEYEGERLAEDDGIRHTKSLVEKAVAALDGDV